MKNLRIITIFSLICLSLAACSSMNKSDAYADLTAQEIFDKGEHQLRHGQYQNAISSFEALESHYPFGELAEKAQLGALYAYYKNGETGAAVAAADRFIRSYPTHENVDYAYYMKGVANYTEAYPFPERYLPLDQANQDTTNLQQAFKDFTDLIKLFPNSQYAADAEQRMHYLRTLLSEHEIKVAEYYMKRGAYLAAANRANYLIQNYQQTAAIPAALQILADAYSKLGLNELAQDAITELNSLETT